MNPTANKRAGAKYETDLVTYLREKGHEAERLRLTGKEDEGDIALRAKDEGQEWYCPTRYVIEAKREQGFHLAQWVKEAELERKHYADHRLLGNYLPERPGFLVVHHARGKSIGQSYVTTTLDEFLSWL